MNTRTTTRRRWVRLVSVLATFVIAGPGSQSLGETGAATQSVQATNGVSNGVWECSRESVRSISRDSFSAAAACYGVGPDNPGFAGLRETRDRMLNRTELRCKALGLAIQEVLNAAILNSLTHARGSEGFRSKAQEWRGLVRSCGFRVSHLRTLLGSLDSGLARSVRSHGSDLAGIESGGVVSLIAEVGREKPEVSEAWSRVARYAEYEFPIRGTPFDEPGTADYVLAKALGATQESLHHDLFLSAFSSVNEAWEDVSLASIEPFLPRGERTINTGKPYEASAVWIDVTRRIQQDAEAYRLHVIMMLRPFLSADDARRLLDGAEVPEELGFGFLLPSAE